MKLEIIMGAVGVALIGYLGFNAAPVGYDISSVFKAAPPRPMSESEKYTNAAKACWENYEKKSNTPAEKVSLASFCEGLEQRAKTGQ